MALLPENKPPTAQRLCMLLNSAGDRGQDRYTPRSVHGPGSLAKRENRVRIVVDVSLSICQFSVIRFELERACPSASIGNPRIRRYVPRRHIHSPLPMLIRNAHPMPLCSMKITVHILHSVFEYMSCPRSALWSYLPSVFASGPASLLSRHGSGCRKDGVSNSPLQR